MDITEFVLLLGQAYWVILEAQGYHWAWVSEDDGIPLRHNLAPLYKCSV